MFRVISSNKYIAFSHINVSRWQRHVTKEKKEPLELELEISPFTQDENFYLLERKLSFWQYTGVARNALYRTTKDLVKISNRKQTLRRIPKVGTTVLQ